LRTQAPGGFDQRVEVVRIAEVARIHATEGAVQACFRGKTLAGFVVRVELAPVGPVVDHPHSPGIDALLDYAFLHRAAEDNYTVRSSQRAARLTPLCAFSLRMWSGCPMSRSTS